ncbi:MAG TPA: hypothetical protein VGD64_04605, partial [Acidisarcina sp.]
MAAVATLLIFTGVAESQVVPAARGTVWPGLELTRQETTMGSPYIPMDSWIYPAMSRLAALGYVDTSFAGLRPWTRLSVANMLAESSERLTDQISGNASTNAATGAADDEASALYLALAREVGPDVDKSADIGHFAQIDQIYTRA